VIVGVLKSAEEKKRMERLIDSLYVNEEIMNIIIINAKPPVQMLKYAFKTLHSLLLEKPKKIAISSELQNKIIEWHKHLHDKLMTSSLLLCTVFEFYKRYR